MKIRLSMKIRFPIVMTLVCVLVAGLVTWQLYQQRDRWTEPAPTKEAVAPELSAFYGQELEWDDCEESHCAWVTVPVDYEKPKGEETRLRVELVPAPEGKGTRTLFVNPGGPGGSAMGFARSMASAVGDRVKARYDIVGVDPRGVGKSSPLICLSDKKFDTYAASDPDPDTPEEITAARRRFAALGKACLDNSGNLASHVSTEEVARDMDIVRALLGRDRLDWFGASYGTQLGATYASLFPERVGRMVLDGAVDPSLDGIESSLADATGFQRALVAYAEDCITNIGCPLSDSVDAGLAKISALLKKLDAAPMKTSSDRKLTEGLAMSGIAVTLYDRRGWNALSKGLTEAFKGDGTTLLLISDLHVGRNPDGTYEDNSGQVIAAVRCLDSGSEGLSQQEAEALIPRFEKINPVFGRSMAWGVMGCQDWPIEATHPQIEISAEDAPTIVVIGTTRDPATPYEGAKALVSQLGNAMLLTREGDGHTAYMSGNSCIKKAVETFLVEGTVPRKGLVCKK